MCSSIWLLSSSSSSLLLLLLLLLSTYATRPPKSDPLFWVYFMLRKWTVPFGHNTAHKTSIAGCSIDRRWSIGPLRKNRDTQNRTEVAGGLVLSLSCAPLRTSVAGKDSSHLFDFIFILFIFIHFVVPVGFFHMENSGCISQGKPAATESRYPTLIN